MSKKNYVWLTDQVLSEQRIVKVEADYNDGVLATHAPHTPYHSRVLIPTQENISWHTTEAGAKARASEMVKSEIAYLAERIVYLTKMSLSLDVVGPEDENAA